MYISSFYYIFRHPIPSLCLFNHRWSSRPCSRTSLSTPFFQLLRDLPRLVHWCLSLAIPYSHNSTIDFFCFLLLYFCSIKFFQHSNSSYLFEIALSCVRSFAPFQPQVLIDIISLYRFARSPVVSLVAILQQILYILRHCYLIVGESK